MKRYEATQMNTCASTDASACAASAMILNMDTAILAVSIFCALIGMISGLIIIICSIIVLVLLVVSICICLAADNFIAPQGRISIRTG